MSRSNSRLESELDNTLTEDQVQSNVDTNEAVRESSATSAQDSGSSMVSQSNKQASNQSKKQSSNQKDQAPSTSRESRTLNTTSSAREAFQSPLRGVGRGTVRQTNDTMSSSEHEDRSGRLIDSVASHRVNTGDTRGAYAYDDRSGGMTGYLASTSSYTGRGMYEDRDTYDTRRGEYDSTTDDALRDRYTKTRGQRYTYGEDRPDFRFSEEYERERQKDREAYTAMDVFLEKLLNENALLRPKEKRHILREHRRIMTTIGEREVKAALRGDGDPYRRREIYGEGDHSSSDDETNDALGPQREELTTVLSGRQVRTLNKFATRFNLDQDTIRAVARMIVYPTKGNDQDSETSDALDSEVRLNHNRRREGSQRERSPENDRVIECESEAGSQRPDVGNTQTDTDRVSEMIDRMRREAEYNAREQARLLRQMEQNTRQSNALALINNRPYQMPQPQFIPQVIHKPPKQYVEMVSGSFSGGDDESIIEFLKIMENQMEIAGIAQAQKPLLLAKCLKGEARTWYNRQPSDTYHSWDKLKRGLIERFNPKGKALDLRLKCYKILQRRDESVNDFIKRCNDRAVVAGFDDRSQMEILINGLLPKVGRFVRLSKPSTFSEAAKEARLYVDIEEDDREDEDRSRKGGYKSRVCSFSTETEERNPAVDQLQQDVWEIKSSINALAQASKKPNPNYAQNQPNVKTQVKCYNCQNLGHISRECKAPRKASPSPQRNRNQKYCSHCKMNNHRLNECLWAQKGMPCPYCTICKKKGHSTEACKKQSSN